MKNNTKNKEQKIESVPGDSKRADGLRCLPVWKPEEKDRGSSSCFRVTGEDSCLLPPPPLLLLLLLLL